MEIDTSLLEQLELSNSEIKVYLALLELESSTVGPIIEKARVPDSKIYMLLEKLKEKGLASYVVKNNVKHFWAADPKRLLGLIEKKEDELKEQKMRISKELIPLIEERRKSTKEKQEATVYESMPGLKTAFQLILDTLEEGEEYYVFMLGEELSENQIKRFFQNYHKKRIERKISVKLLAPRYLSPVLKEWYDYEAMEIRYTKEKLPVGTFIFSGHVMTVVWGEKPTAFTIKSEKNYSDYKEFFDHMWKKAE